MYYLPTLVRSLRRRSTFSSQQFSSRHSSFRQFSSSSTGWFPSSCVVVGAGQMGAGIALSVADTAERAGRECRVTVMDRMGVDVLKERKKEIGMNLQRWFDMRRMEENRKTELQKIVALMDFISLPSPDEINNEINHKWKEHLQSSELIIEAIPENVQMKTSLFQLLRNIDVTAQVIASNTSSISISLLASFMGTEMSERVIGMHFMNPVPRMSLVEVISAAQTNSATTEKVHSLAKWMGKEVGTSRDFPGFIANRVLMVSINEAVLCLQEDMGSKEDIDKIMKLGTNAAMGPLRLADLIGLDTCLYILKELEKGYGPSRFHPAPLLVQYVHAGWLGRKAGRGFYTY